ncbi:MAG: tripartite tricarboxylate transporter TctB family protein [Tissierellia bacterium]|nr:tripartite tricarboxylate transporter TctB family protein [Tissierellia bacterium]
MKKVDMLLGFILLAICGFFYFMISRLPEKAILYPIFVTTVLLILTLIHLITTYLKKEDEESNAFKGLEIKQLLFVIATSGLYVVLINIAGYVTSTVLYVLSTLFGLKVSKKASALISIGFSICIYVLFKILLKVPLPKGFII